MMRILVAFASLSGNTRDPIVKQLPAAQKTGS